MLTLGQGFGQSSAMSPDLEIPSELVWGSNGEALCEQWVLQGWCPQPVFAQHLARGAQAQVRLWC